MKELIETLARALVDLPDQVSVNQIDGQHSTILELKVDKSDVGKVIGKHGHTASALRTLLSAASAKKHIRTVLEIID